MKNSKITSFQWFIMAFFLLNSFIPLIGYHTLTKVNNTTSLISIIIGYFLITIFIFTMKNILNYKKNLTIIDKIDKLFPKIKMIFYLVFTTIIIISLLYSLNNLVTFINYYVLKEVSLIIITLSLLLTVFYCLTKQLDSIFRLAEIFFYIYLFILIITLIGTGKYINLYNIKPLLASPLENTITTSMLYFVSSIIPLFLLQIIPYNKVIKKNKDKFNLYNATKLSSLVIFINLFTIITSLGIELTNVYLNPDMILYKKISFLNILERVESTIAFNNILNSFFFILLGIYFLKNLIIKSFSIKKEKETVSLSLIIIILTIISTILTIPQNIYLITSIVAFIIIIIINIKIIIDKYTHH